MTRLIDADALLEDLSIHLIRSGSVLFSNDVLTLITNAPTVQREGWLSAEDRLPDETYVDVLIYPYLGDDNCVITAHLDADRTWRYYEPSLRFANLPCSPTYWQQLPASPTDTE